MIVKLLAPWATASFNYPAGSLVEIDIDQAHALVEDKKAEFTEPIPPVLVTTGPVSPPRHPTVPIVVQNTVPDAIAQVGATPYSPAPPVSFIEAPEAAKAKVKPPKPTSETAPAEVK